MRRNFWINTVVRTVGLPLKLASRNRGVNAPRKVVILKPCCLGQVMQTTPMLSALANAFPGAQIDWVVGEWSRPAVVSNPRLTNIIEAGNIGLPDCPLSEWIEFGRSLRAQHYDTCIVPSRSTGLSLLGWYAGIPQRIGLDISGRGVAHTVGVSHQSDRPRVEGFLALAQALGASSERAKMEFYPRDSDRNSVIEWLLDEFGWREDRPLMILHPGGGISPATANRDKLWPIERFARLANHFVKKYGAQVLIVGGEEDKKLAADVAGIISTQVLNLAGRVDLGQLGALCEFASLYVGNEAGTTYVAAAVGCPTIAIYGPQQATYTHPHDMHAHFKALWHPYSGSFTWDKGISTAEVIEQADRMLADRPA